MSYRLCFLAQSNLTPGERERMPERLAALRAIRYGSAALTAQEQRNFIEIQKTGKIQRNARQKSFVPRSGPGEVSARPTDQASGSFSQGTQGGFNDKYKIN